MATLDQLERAHTAGYVLQLKDVLEQVRDAGEPKALDPDTVACPTPGMPRCAPPARPWRPPTT
jgi:hypothetical protein